MNEIEYQQQRDANLEYKTRNLLVNYVSVIFARPWFTSLLSSITRVTLFLQGLGSGSIITRSGESHFLKRILKSNQQNMTIFDVGGNLGDYSAEILKNKADSEIHIFEPSSFLNTQLQNRFQGIDNVYINSQACSDKIETQKLVAPRVGATTGSIHHQEGEKYSHVEEIQCTTIDEYMSIHDIGEVGLLKVDVEGHELKVLLGASEALSRKKIQIIQFDGGASPNSKIFFEDFWLLFAKHGYEIYRMLPMGVIRIKKYRHLDECCLPTIYLAVRPGKKLPD